MRNLLLLLLLISCSAKDKKVVITDDDIRLLIDGNTEIITKRLKSSPSLIEAKDSSGATFLQIATFLEDLGLVRLFLTNGADANTLAEDNSVALHVATRKGNLDISKELINHGAEIDIKNVAGLTPLHYAVISGNEKLVQYLINKGAEINCMDQYGATPFDLSIKYKKIPIILLLQEYGAEPNLMKKNVSKVTYDPINKDLEVKEEKILSKKTTESNSKKNSSKLPEYILKENKNEGHYSIELQRKDGIPEFDELRKLASHLNSKDKHSFIRLHFYFPGMNNSGGSFITAEENNGNFYLKYVSPSRLPDSYKGYMDSWLNLHMKNKNVFEISISNGPLRPPSRGYRIED